MADNASMSSTTDVIRTVDRSGVETQVAIIDINGSGAESLLSPTNPMPVNIAASGGATAQTSQSLTASAATTLAGTTSTSGSWVLDVSAAGNASFDLTTAAFVGTVVFEQSFDATGANGSWAPIPCLPEDATTSPANTLAISTAVAYVKQFTSPMFGPKLFRVRCSAFTSGALLARGSAGPGWYEGQPSLAPSSATIGVVGLAGVGSTYAVTTVNTSGTANTNSTLVGANAARQACMVWNAGTGVVSLGFGTSTTATLYSIRLQPAQGYEIPPQFVQGAITCQSTVATNPVNVSSVT